MAVFRIEKNSNYTTMSNYHLRDINLSLKAKGLMSICLSLPEDWDYSVNGLVAIVKEGRDAILAAVQELEREGYITREQTRTADGKMGGTVYNIFEFPRLDNPMSEKPTTVKPTTDTPMLAKPLTENPLQISTDIQNKDLINNREKKESRNKYGRYRNVLFTDEEYAVLQSEFPADYAMRIERLSEYMASTGKSYKNRLATIRSWARKEKTKKSGFCDESYYHFEEGESL